jgi:hypothetical protein
MKKIQREETVVVRKDIYVSVDGREFTNEADCKAWESSYKCTLEASWKLIKKEEVNPCSLGLYGASEDHECYVIKPKDLNEIVLINAYIKSTTDSGEELTIEHIGQLVALNFGWDHDYCYACSLADRFNEITKYTSTIADKFDETENA